MSRYFVTYSGQEGDKPLPGFSTLSGAVTWAMEGYRTHALIAIWDAAGKRVGQIVPGRDEGGPRLRMFFY